MAYVSPGSFTSSVYVADPVMRRGSSRRLMPDPKRVLAMGSRSLNAGGGGLTGGRGRLRGPRLGLGGTQGGCRGLDRLHDVLVSGAAAEIAFERVPNLFFAGIWVALKQIDRRHDHARRAEPALKPVLLPECRLERMQAVG